MTQKPSQGRVVLYKVQESEFATNNNASTAPATVVRVWDGTPGNLVNLKVHTDAAEDLWRSSVPYAGDDATEETAPEFSWFWPPRV